MSGLQAWLQANHAVPPVALRAHQIPGKGGAMIARQPIKKGDKLVNVPRNLWMTSETAKTAPLCGELVQEHRLDPWKALSLHLLCERRHGKLSFWREYIRQLPDQADHPLLWNEEQLSWLKGSPMCKKLAQRAKQVQNDIHALVEAGANDIRWEPGVEEPLITTYSAKWAAATLLSRAFNLDIPTQSLNGSNGTVVEVPCDRLLALVPWADSLNHCSTATERSVLQYDASADAAVLYAHRDYAEGDEVSESYGTWLTPSELLLDYGFVDEKNKTNAITVPATAIVKHASAANKALLKAVDGCFNGSPEMTVTETGIDDTLLSYMRCCVTPKEHLVDAGWRSDWTPDGDNPNLPLDVMSRLVEPVDFNTEAKVLETLMAWCDAQLAGYTSAVQNDLEEMHEQTTPWIRVQVLRALVSEKKTLMGLQRQLRDRMQQLKEGCPLETLYV